MEIKDVIIVGAGPAGIATAIQLNRYHIEPVIFEEKEIGGLLRNAHRVENYPGFPGGLSGLDLVGLFMKQLQENGIEVRFEKVMNLDYKDDLFRVKTNRRSLRSKVAVVASGTKPKMISTLLIPDDAKDCILYEIDTIRGIENKRIAIIGAGDAAFDYGFNLAQSNKVVILNRGKQFKCIPVLWERCRNLRNISYLNNIGVTEVHKERNTLRLTLASKDNPKVKQMLTDYLIVTIGREPRRDFLSETLEKNMNKLVERNVLYLIGDVKNAIYRQTAICVGDGVRTAMEIFKNRVRQNP